MKRYRLLHLPTSRFVIVDKVKRSSEALDSWVSSVSFGLDGLWITKYPENLSFFESTRKADLQNLISYKKYRRRLYSCLAVDLLLINNAMNYNIETHPFSPDEFDIVEFNNDSV